MNGPQTAPDLPGRVGPVQANGSDASLSVYQLHLLDEVTRLFKDADWQQVRTWLNEQTKLQRLRQEPFVPAETETLLAEAEPVLQAGDAVRRPILSRRPTLIIPQGCQLSESVYALGSVEVGPEVQIVGDLLAREAVQWNGGTAGIVRHLVAREVIFGREGGTVLGGLWCDTVGAGGAAGASLPARTSIRGVAVIDQPAAGRLTVGPECQLGGLWVRGSVETEHGAVLSVVQAEGAVRIGNANKVGHVEGERVTIESHAQVSRVVSAGSVVVRGDAVVDHIQAEGTITLDADVTITGNMLRSEHGTFEVPEGPRWHSQRQHWFYLSPDAPLRPYGGERPAGSALVAIRALTHRLWHQSQQLAGRG